MYCRGCGKVYWRLLFFLLYGFCSFGSLSSLRKGAVGMLSGVLDLVLALPFLLPSSLFLLSISLLFSLSLFLSLFYLCLYSSLFALGFWREFIFEAIRSLFRG